MTTVITQVPQIMELDKVVPGLKSKYWKFNRSEHFLTDFYFCEKLKKVLAELRLLELSHSIRRGTTQCL